MADYYCRDRVDTVYHQSVRGFFDQEKILASYKNSEYEQFMECTVQEDGVKKRIRITFLLSKDSTTGKIIALCTVKDITDSYNRQLHIEEMTKAAELSEAIATINEALGSGSWSMEFDENAQMVSCTWSDTFRRMVGAESREDYPDVIESWSDMLHPEDKEKILKAYWDTVNDYSGQKTYDVVYRLKTRNRGYRWFKALGRLTRRADGSPVTYYGVFIDIEDEVRANEELIQTRKDLEDALDAAQHANRAKTTFLNNMSHDIRTPMNAIMGMTTVAAMNIDDKERLKDCLNKITLSSRHLLALINDVLDMSKIESGKVTLSEEEFDMAKMVENLLAIIHPQIQEKNQQLKINISNITHEDVIGDPLHLQQVFVNIMGNAVKFTPEGGMISFSICEKPSRIQGSGCYEFIFEDTGIGMKEEFVETIFEPFARENSASGQNIEGTGLGMSIANNIVRMMNGNIQVESTPGVGSKFTVQVYLKLQNEKTEEVECLKELRVLVADDEPDACENACEILNSIGMSPDGVLSGDEAIRKLSEAHENAEDYAVVILDWKMPGKCGVETTREIRKQSMPLSQNHYSSHAWSMC